MGALFARSPDEELAAQRQCLAALRRPLVRDAAKAEREAGEALNRARWALRDGHDKVARDLLQTQQQKMRHVARFRALVRELDELSTTTAVQTTRVGMQQAFGAIQGALARALDLVPGDEFAATLRAYRVDAARLSLRQTLANEQVVDAAADDDASADADDSSEAVEAALEALRFEAAPVGVRARAGTRPVAAASARDKALDDLLAQI